MYNNLDDEIPFLTKVKIVAALTLGALLVVAVIAGSVAFQRQAKANAAELAKTQASNVEAIKTLFPDYREYAEFKEKVDNLSIVKVKQEDLPATITAGLDESVDPNPWESEGLPPYWEVKKDGSTVASSTSKNGWDFNSGGSVSIPVDAPYGKYQIEYNSEEQSDTDPWDGAYIWYTYAFKITPPCPTSVSLGISGG